MHPSSRIRAGLLLSSWLALCAAPSSAATDPVDAEALRYQLLDALLSVGNRPLPKTSDCSFLGPQRRPGPLTVGRWIAWNLQFMAPGQANSVTSVCHDKKGARATCDVQFNADSTGESPWSCGFRFDVSLPSYTLDASTLTCIGSC